LSGQVEGGIVEQQRSKQKVEQIENLTDQKMIKIPLNGDVTADVMK
jgi:hypothetical protein